VKIFILGDKSVNFLQKRGFCVDRNLIEIYEKVKNGERLTFEDGLKLFNSDDLITIGMMADMVRWRLHPEPVVTYIIDRNINYTNICTTECTFCAFYAKVGDTVKGYTLDYDTIAKKIEETIQLGGTRILLQGGLNPELGIEFYEELFRWIKANYPQIWLHALSPEEILHIASVSRMKVRDVLKRLIEAGLQSIPGGGAEILVDRVREKISPKKCTADEWLGVMYEAQKS
jgi:cyclic dehypoxanthinyl futalosine synthase